MTSKWLYILGIILIAGFAVRGAMELQSASTPYVTSVAEVKSHADGQVQFIGAIDHKTVRYSDSADELLFVLKDEKGESLRVRYSGVKPANFDSREKAVVRGKMSGSEFVADQLMLKCPSKYQGK